MKHYLGLLLVVLSSIQCQANTDVKGLFQVSAISNNSPASYQNSGVGILRSAGNDVLLNQALLSIDHDISDNWQITGVANAYSDGESRLGLTQLFANYRPLSSGLYKQTIKVGLFYPALSVENTDVGWLSEDFISNSAINSWVGEELRIVGAQWSLRRPGRAARSPWTWETFIGTFKGNDTLGTQLTWRGFAMHDRQTLFKERVNFAAYPSVVADSMIMGPSWTKPFKEMDGKWGYYVGMQWQYTRQLDVRYFYYDNRADPTVVNKHRLYAWRTKFHSLAARYRLSPTLTLSGHVMLGSTLMGQRVVYADYYAAYAALSYRLAQHKFSVRIDWFEVNEDDNYAYDANDSDGKALTLNWQYTINKHTKISTEALWLKSFAASRRGYWQPAHQTDTQLQVGVTYQF